MYVLGSFGESLESLGALTSVERRKEKKSGTLRKITVSSLREDSC